MKINLDIHDTTTFPTFVLKNDYQKLKKGYFANTIKFYTYHKIFVSF